MRFKSRVSMSTSSTMSRRAASLLASCVSDAAARPLHWIYDAEKLEQCFNGETGVSKSAPEFYPESRSPFYALPTGDNSCYGDEVLAGARALKKSNDTDALSSQLAADFGAGSQYDNLEEKKAFLGQLRADKEKAKPLQGRWMNGAVDNFLQKKASGAERPFGKADSMDSDGFCLALPYILNGGDDYKAVLKAMTTNETALAYSEVAASILRKFLDGKPDAIDEAIKEVGATHPEIHAKLSEAVAMSDVDHAEAVAKFGKACSFPGALQGAVHAVKNSGRSDLAGAVRMTLLAGGDCCSRAVYIGAFMGAKLGEEAIPKEWVEKTAVAEEVKKLAAGIWPC